ncbi:MAG: TetR/AcrR family transcriptional regulator [Bacteroidales bacterium]|nr:TetR/AcrR family transcriptional regulator [Lentimicrobiaceae bacterium]MDD5694140.1 TetR/AcrR family transcriptional regulator [Bacteroidales bacterium]
MPRTEKQYEEIRENRKALIMETALELFANEGYYPTSISKIAKKAGISKGLMYNYFPSKEQLIREIIDQGIQDLLTTFDPDKDGVLTEMEFEFMINAIFGILQENIRYWRLYFSLIMQASVHPLVHEGFAKLVPRLLQTQVHYFEKKGVSDPVSEAIFFAAVLDGIAFNFIIDPDHFPVTKIKQLIIEKFNYINSNDYEN